MIREPRRPVKQRPRSYDHRDPEHERLELPEPIMRDRPEPRNCDECGRMFRPESWAHADAVTCTWCVFHEGMA